jgi:hypothetical protein
VRSKSKPSSQLRAIVSSMTAYRLPFVGSTRVHTSIEKYAIGAINTRKLQEDLLGSSQTTAIGFGALPVGYAPLLPQASAIDQLRPERLPTEVRLPWPGHHAWRYLGEVFHPGLVGGVGFPDLVGSVWGSSRSAWRSLIRRRYCSPRPKLRGLKEAPPVHAGGFSLLRLDNCALTTHP